MLRDVVEINEELCVGCGLCVGACEEGAIVLQNGKARLLREDFCDGLGNCLPACPVDAIEVVEREAEPFDAQAVESARRSDPEPRGVNPLELCAPAYTSKLSQWPCQIRLVPARAPYFNGADLLVAADCTAFACAGFHGMFMAGRTTVVGCPKLDDVDYAEKLAQILAGNDVRAVTVARMDVPCCKGLQAAAERALAACGKDLPFTVITIGRDGGICPPERR